MPRQTIYIRDADLQKWKALDNKSERISKMLNEADYPVPINVGVSSPVWKKDAIPRHTTTPIPQTWRTPQIVWKEIDSYKAELKERLEYCQDADERSKIEQEGKDTMDALWTEYHQLKAELNDD